MTVTRTPKATLDPNNSTDDTLAGDATFTGSWRDITAMAGVAILVSADVAGTAFIDWSDDGGTTTHYTDTQAVVAGTPSWKPYPQRGEHYRVRYTNGVTGQTAFHLGAWQQPTDLVTADVVLSAQRPDGTFHSVEQDADGNLNINVNAATSEVPITSLSTGSTEQETIGTSVIQIADPPLADRRSISIKSFSGNTDAIYIGFTSGVASGSGFPLDAGESVDLEVTDSLNIYAIAAAAGQRLAWMELGT